MNTIDTDTYEYYIRENDPWRKASTEDIIRVLAMVDDANDYILKEATCDKGFYKKIQYTPDWTNVPLSDADYIMCGDGDWALVRFRKSFLHRDTNCFEHIPGNCGEAEILFNIPQEMYEDNDELMQIF